MNTLTLFSPQMRVQRMRRRILTTARLVQERIPKHWRAVMITLTYAAVDGWKADHMSAFTDCVRKYLRRRGLPFRYVWVMEYQKRGAPHYHLVCWLPPRFRLPKPDVRGWWPHGSTEVAREKTNVVGYVAKVCGTASSGYCAKEYTEYEYKIPRARISSAGGIYKDAREIVRWWLLPGWLRQWSDDLGLDKVGSYFLRLTGIGWLCVKTGEIRGSPMQLHGVGTHELTFRHATG